MVGAAQLRVMIPAPGNKKQHSLLTSSATNVSSCLQQALFRGDAIVGAASCRHGRICAAVVLQLQHLTSHLQGELRSLEEYAVATIRKILPFTFQVVSFAALILAGTAQADDKHSPDAFYTSHVLVSDGAIPAAHIDPNLKNGWGVVFNPNGFVWVTDNGSGKSTLYDGDGVPQSLVVTIPGAGGAQGAPTGIVFSSSNDFAVTQTGISGPSRFIFAGEDGTISGWAPNVDGTHAILAVDNSPSKAVYKGLALASNGNGNFLYAADFHNGKVAVFDSKFQPASLPGNFSDPRLPAGFAPFGIQNLNGNLYVTYAKQDADRHDDVAGPGLGFVNVFNANGQLIRRIASRGALNAPWGLALAPADFGIFSNALLVGNFGDGRINAYDLPTGNFLGQMRGPDGKRLVIDGLWGFAFGNGINDQPTNVLFFAAGPNGESDGAYGRIEPSNNGLFGFSEGDD
jgi:uncharacterized protein (TIGR03118 family)